VLNAPSETVKLERVHAVERVNLRRLIARLIILIKREQRLGGSQCVGHGNQSSGAIITKGRDDAILIRFRHPPAIGVVGRARLGSIREQRPHLAVQSVKMGPVLDIDNSSSCESRLMN